MMLDITEIDGMAPKDFESFIGEMLNQFGWGTIHQTKVGKDHRWGDGGIDFVCHHGSRSIAIEVKHTQGGKITTKALEQLHTGAELANIREKILVTNGLFTEAVHERAMQLGVDLIDREKLRTIIRTNEFGPATKYEPRKYQEKVVCEIERRFAQGKSKQFIYMATGLGKTATSAFAIHRLIKDSSRPFKTLVLVHQVEILKQNYATYKNILGSKY